MKKQIYTRDEVISTVGEIMLAADAVMDYINNENTDYSDEDLLGIAEKDMVFNVDAVELIAIERYETQIEKHGFTSEHHAKHPEWYDKGQLIEAANTLSMKEIKSCLVPYNWDAEWFNKLCLKSHKERLIISATLLASEWDRLYYLENNNTGERV